jgi:hypothetical protein
MRETQAIVPALVECLTDGARDAYGPIPRAHARAEAPIRHSSRRDPARPRKMNMKGETLSFFYILLHENDKLFAISPALACGAGHHGVQVSALEALRSIAFAQRGSGDVESRERIVAAVRGKMTSPDWLVRQAPSPISPSSNAGATIQ